MNNIIEKIKSIASKVTHDDKAAADGDEYLDIHSICGGNIDDAYYAGKEDGEIEFARELLKLIESNT